MQGGGARETSVEGGGRRDGEEDGSSVGKFSRWTETQNLCWKGHGGRYIVGVDGVIVRVGPLLSGRPEVRTPPIRTS